jgi:hypothetical protein
MVTVMPFAPPKPDEVSRDTSAPVDVIVVRTRTSWTRVVVIVGGFGLIAWQVVVHAFG